MFIKVLIFTILAHFFFVWIFNSMILGSLAFCYLLFVMTIVSVVKDKIESNSQEYLARIKFKRGFCDSGDINTLEWIVNYCISKNSYPFMGKNRVHKLKCMLDELNIVGIDDMCNVKKTKELCYESVDNLRYRALNRMKYKKCECVDIDIKELLEEVYNRANNKKKKLLIDKWLFKQIIDEKDNYGIVTEKEIIDLKSIT